ncbi:MAG: hypothetical protein ACRDTR_16765, partial [Rubrobacter sp.]
MQEVRVESLDKLEALGGCMRLSANAGSLSIVFSKEIWDQLLANASAQEEPTPEELVELDLLRDQLEAHAREHSFERVLRNLRCGDSDLEY